MRTVAITALLGISAIAALAAVQPVPRPSPEFVVTMPDGKQMLLSQFKGKVCAIEFLFTTCPHCQHEAELVSNIHRDLGPKGFQPIGVAINVSQDKIGAMLVNDFVRDHKVAFPVGLASRESALGYLGISSVERWVVPQMVIIDRKGTIRYQTAAMGSEDVQNETWLRGKIEELLKEGVGPAAKKTGGASNKRTASTAPAGAFAHH
jgi:peroxiredoxin